MPARAGQARPASSRNCSQTIPIVSTAVSMWLNSDAPLNSTKGENISSAVAQAETGALAPRRRSVASDRAASAAVSSGLASQPAWISRNGASSAGQAGGYCENHLPSRTNVQAISKIAGAGGAGFHNRPCSSVRARNT